MSWIRRAASWTMRVLGHARSSGTETGTYLENYIRKRFPFLRAVLPTYLCVRLFLRFHGFFSFALSFALLRFPTFAVTIEGQKAEFRFSFGLWEKRLPLLFGV